MTNFGTPGSFNGSPDPFAQPDGDTPPPEFTSEMLSQLISTFCIVHHHDYEHQLAKALVRQAGQLAMLLRKGGLETEYKTSVSDVVTQADRFAERFISEVLEDLQPEDGIVGEEGAFRESRSGKFWVIDPIDGTYNYTAGSDYWCSALALVEGNPDNPDAVHFGAVHRPSLDESWFGGPDRNTRRDTTDIQVYDDKPDQLCLGGYLHPTDFKSAELTEAWLEVVESFATQRMHGSASIDLANVADGRLGCWMQHSVKSWDWLPGRALVEGAGGATARVEAGGVEWFIAGGNTAVQNVTLILDKYRKSHSA